MWRMNWREASAGFFVITDKKILIRLNDTVHYCCEVSCKCRMNIRK